MSSSSTNNRNLVLGGLAAVAAGLGLYLWYRSGQKASDGSTTAVVPSAAKKDKVVKKKSSKKSKKAKSALTREKLISLFSDITRSMQAVVMQLAQMEQAIKSQSNVPEEELATYMMQQFEQAMKTVENNVYAKYSTTEAEVQELAKTFEDDAEFKAVVGKLQKLYAAIAGQQLVEAEVPEHLTMQKMVTIMEKLFEGMTQAMEEIVGGVRQEHGADASKELIGKAISDQYNERVVSIRNAINKEYGISQEVLQAGMLKYQGEAEFATRMEELTQTQKEKLEELGIAES
jgi:hypothetical protein